ncbi:hypothetical protein cypCar_00044111, partial [Cyprinus carpio]
MSVEQDSNLQLLKQEIFIVAKATTTHDQTHFLTIGTRVKQILKMSQPAEEIPVGQVFPGPPGTPNVVSAFKNCIKLTWTPPEKNRGTKILGYQLEKRKRDSNQWVTLNPVKDPIQALKYAVKDGSEGSEYEFRVSAIIMSGPGEPSAPSVMICAKNPNKNKFIFGTQVSPPPDITWLKNGEPVSPWNKIIHADGTLVIPSSKYSDSGVYNIIAKNSSGQASFDIE